VTGREKIDAAIDHLVSRGVSVNTAAPPQYRVFWFFSTRLPPPHFQTFVGLVTFNTLFFGAILSTLGLVFEQHHAPVWWLIGLGVSGGCVLGLIHAPLYRWKAWRLGLPHWNDFPTASTEDDPDW